MNELLLQYSVSTGLYLNCCSFQLLAKSQNVWGWKGPLGDHLVQLNLGQAACVCVLGGFLQKRTLHNLSEQQF